MALDNVNLSEGRHPRSALRSCSPSTLCTHRGRRPKKLLVSSGLYDSSPLPETLISFVIIVRFKINAVDFESIHDTVVKNVGRDVI